ncbi:MAG: FdhF/YdeP family oxidoreductase, partial [Phycisphaerales bacterium]|nr:FdhF/YdeP family oxidoreductase [Phycisphaerales bacterium]
MAKRPKHGGGWPAVLYTIRTARATGGIRRMWHALRSRNACKTCALGMGGQLGGMVNEQGRFPEFCKKSVQAMGADLQPPISPEMISSLTFERLQQMDSRDLERLGRLSSPMIAGPLDLAYRPISWTEAMDRLNGVMQKATPDRSFFYLSGRSSNEASFLLQVVARLWGTNNINNCSYYCHQASGVGLASVTGSGTATVDVEDLEHCDLVFLIGANPSSNHPRLMRSLMDLKRRGGKVIVINPLHEVGLQRFKIPSDVRSMLRASRIADLYVQPHAGGDPMLLTGITKAIIERGAVDQPFVHHHAQGWDDLVDVIASINWDEIVEGSGVSREQIDQIADLYASSSSTIFCWAMGLTHHANGVQNIQHVANLAISRGMLGAPGRGLLPLRGHSNVQGIGSVGVVPKLKEAFFNALESDLGVNLPTSEGLDTLGCMEAAERGEIDLAWCLGGNLWGSNPDLKFASRSLASIDTVVYLSTTMNGGHVHGRGRETIVLPVLARDEEPQSTTQESMFNYVRLSDGGEHRIQGPRAESEIIADVAEALLGDQSPIELGSMRDHASIRGMIARVVPGYEAIGRMDQEEDRKRREFQIDGRTFHEPYFNTESRRAMVHPLKPMAPPSIESDQVRIMTLRSEGQFNTVVYENSDFYRGQDRRDVILMNQSDMDRMGIAADAAVMVTTEVGDMEVIARAYSVPAGNAAMYYPEANVLVPRNIDPKSRTPAYKSVVATITL